jgi:hypothetical protein
MIYLPQNPCCTTIPVVTCGCDPCSTPLTPTNNVAYSGPNLSCTLIATYDTATVAFQKIDTQICSLKQQIYNLQVALGNCCPTTTTTSTSTSSTTTTTTTIACPSCKFYSVENSTVSEVEVVYYQCGGILVNANVVGPTTIYICACEDSVVIPPVPGVTLTDLGDCPATTTTTTTLL